jgi:eukaryotic-like serine/threonine-protein kinase
MIGKMVSKYHIIEEIGRGAMGIVFKAQDTVLGRRVALKILAEKLVNDPEMLHRFEREGRAASALNHPNICTAFESGNWLGRPYIAMELLQGRTLDDRLRDGGRIPPVQLIEIALDVTAALDATHAIGVVHRDIKPANLFLTATGLVKVLDFGLAKERQTFKRLDQEDPEATLFATRQGMVVGTLAYMSPEQVCCEPLDGRADLYSLGVTLYELATGELPVRGSENMAALGSGLGPIVIKLMAYDAGKRYQTAREVCEELRREAPREQLFRCADQFQS